MRKFGLIGFPLSHSFSPSFFAEKFAKENIQNCSYEAFPIESIESFPELLISQPELEGINVTIPFKKSVIPFLNYSSEPVFKTGACNCITIKEGRLYGYNTDVIGVENRKARFRTVISLLLNGQHELFEGVCEGEIIQKQKGIGGFGYDSVFVPEGSNKTFGEMELQEKNKFSHRKKATEKLALFLSNFGKK